jgi:CRISPR/Cas system CMR-associated protein Cmr5 small subunit
MRTLSQIRAANALTASKIPGMGHGQMGGDALSGFSMMIKTNGLLATAAFSVETKEPKEGKKGKERKHEGHYLIIEAIAGHLASKGVEICDATRGADLVEELSLGDVRTLTRATAEAIAYLSYLKRFVA